MKRERIYKFADVVVSIEANYPYTIDLCQNYEVYDSEEVQLKICVNTKDIRQEALKTDKEYGDDYLESLAIYRNLCELLLEHDTFLFHCSAVAVDGEAYLFTAPSGTGKSTHVQIWKKCFGEKAFIVNDDKPLVKVQGETVYVCGTPWSGKHNLNCNCKVPVKGICVLKRGAENFIEEISIEESILHLYPQIYRPNEKSKMEKTLTLLKKTSELVPIYNMSCNISEEAAWMAYRKMNKRGTE